VTEEMTEHYSHLDRAEMLRAADQVVALAAIRGVSNENSVAPIPRRPCGGDLSSFGDEVKSPPSPSGGSGGGRVSGVGMAYPSGPCVPEPWRAKKAEAGATVDVNPAWTVRE
jgi:hypothetical protein